MKSLIALITLIAITCAPVRAEWKASCHITNDTGVPEQRVEGLVTFTQPAAGETVTVTVKLSGFNKTDGVTEHGFHIHERGLVTNKCLDAGPHFNPTSVVHGGPHSSVRHVGDLGNVHENADGTVDVVIKDDIIDLSGPNSIVQRTVVVHAVSDDLGLGNFLDSNTTGHAGARLGCCTIQLVSGSHLVHATSLVLWAVVFCAVAMRIRV